jgi:hypothetical protein
LYLKSCRRQFVMVSIFAVLDPRYQVKMYFDAGNYSVQYN